MNTGETGKNKVKGEQNQSGGTSKNKAKTSSKKNAKESGNNVSEPPKPRSNLQETSENPLQAGKKSDKKTLKETASHSNDKVQHCVDASTESEKGANQPEEEEVADSESNVDEDDNEEVCEPSTVQF